MGLRDSHHIPRIVIHPKNPDVVYVASMGHLYSENPERGVFKTTDGGKTWSKVFYISEKVGVVDLVMNPKDPDVLYAASYDKRRLPWAYENGGPESGIYKTADGGKTWARLGGGLPGGRIGRIGLDIYPRNPEILYAVVENANTRPATPEEIEQAKARGRQARDTMIGGEAYRTEDGGKTWAKMNSDKDDISGKGPYYFNQIRVDPNDDKNIFVTGVSLANSTDGGKTWNDLNWPPQRMFAKIFGDVRTLWIDPRNSDRMILGSDGGIYLSYDGGRTGDHCYNIPMGEWYAIAVDMEDPYNIYGGLQDHEMWKGPSNGPSGEITMFDWVALGGGDGFFTQPDPADSRWVYTTMQYGGHYRVDQKLGYRISILPQRESGKDPYRFIWCTPIHFSPHNSNIIYTGGQCPSPVDGPGRPLAGDQPRPEHERQVEDPAQFGGRTSGGHSLVRHLLDLGIARHARPHLGGNERRERPGHPERRSDLDRLHPEDRRRRRPERMLREPGRGLPPQGRPGLHRQERL